MLPAVDVACSLDLAVAGSALLALQVAAVGGDGVVQVLQDGAALTCRESTTDAGGRTQLVQLARGTVQVHYAASVPSRAQGSGLRVVSLS